jgi:membrane protein YqaA with SNARE-associated domain
MSHAGWLAGLYYAFLGMGWFGIVLLSLLDSSFLVLPFANDFAVIILSSLHHLRFPLYAAAAAAGSTAGCAVMYWLGRKGGQAFIQANVSPQRFERMHKKVSQRGPFMLALPALIPPPFPFRFWVIAAGALEVPRKPFLASLGAMRLLRFFAEGLLALWVGRAIVAWMHRPWFVELIKGLMVLAILASAASLYRLIRSTRRK